MTYQSGPATTSEMADGAQILFMKHDGSVTAEPFDPIIPVLRLSIRPAALENTFTSAPGTDHIIVNALIDTGADGVFIDEEFAERHGFLSSGTTIVQSASHTSMQSVYPALFQLVDDAAGHYTQAASFTSSPLRKNGRKYDVVLGTLFLCNGSLVMDFPSRIFRFEFATKPDKE